MSQKLARCRWCDKNDIPFEEMAIGSYKVCGQFTGVCKKCISSEEKEREYINRIERVQND